MTVVDASPQSSIRSWTHGDVKSWLKDVGLEDRSVNKPRVSLKQIHEFIRKHKERLARINDIHST